MTRTREKVLAHLRHIMKPDCESYEYAEGYECTSHIGCDWIGSVFPWHGTPSWNGYKRDNAKLERIAIKLSDELDSAEITERLNRLRTKLSSNSCL